MTAPMNSKNPALVLEHRWAGRGTNPLAKDRRTAPMAVTLEHGVPQVIADDDSTPQFRVPAVIDVTALAAALNSQLNGADVTNEADGFLAAVAGAFAMGMEHQRNLAEVA